ncbi:hypothetical protein RCL1_005680 [Eukaryota sp. TZLM3-RCL]
MWKRYVKHHLISFHNLLVVCSIVLLLALIAVFSLLSELHEQRRLPSVINYSNFPSSSNNTTSSLSSEYSNEYCVPFDVIQTISSPKTLTIDLLIPWVDGSDPKWLEKKNNFSLKKQDLTSNRFTSHDELKYCLRSIEKHFPDFGTIYLLTDNQRPDWLNDNERVKIISHKDIVPEHLHDEVLPTFNSQSFEVFLWNIPGISDNYLYLNDDFFFGADVDLSYFLNDQFYTVYYDETKILNREPGKVVYHHMMRHNINLIEKKLGSLKPKIDFRYIAHAPRLINKQLFKHVFNMFEEAFLEAARTKFRGEGSLVEPLSLYIFTLGSLSNSTECGREFIHFKRSYMSYVSLRKNIRGQKRLFEAIQVVKPPFFNVNDNLEGISESNSRVVDESLKIYYSLMDSWYGEKSSFET